MGSLNNNALSPESANEQCIKIPKPIPTAELNPALNPEAKVCLITINVSGPGDATAKRCAIKDKRIICKLSAQSVN